MFSFSSLRCENSKTKNVCRCWSCDENGLFEYGACVICSAYKICADDVVDKNAIALPYIVRNKQNTKKRKDV